MSADPGRAPSPQGPDPLVFGWRPSGVPAARPMRYCGCGAAQAVSAGDCCWQCGPDPSDDQGKEVTD